MKTTTEPDGWLQTYSGMKFTPLNPKVEQIDIIDIAHALSHLCRFGGHIRSFYSVAEHSVRCCWETSPEFRLAALLHDASEAYLVDVPRPIKRYLGNYVELEAQIQRVVGEKFGIDPELFSHPEIKRVDNLLLVTEARDLLGVNARTEWGYDFDPLPISITPYGNPKSTFLHVFNGLVPERHRVQVPATDFVPV